MARSLVCASGARTALSKIDLSRSDLCDQTAIVLAEGMFRNGAVKELVLEDISGSITSGWVFIISVLKSPYYLSCIFPGNYPKLPGIYPVSPILTRDGVKCNE